MHPCVPNNCSSLRKRCLCNRRSSVMNCVFLFAFWRGACACVRVSSQAGESGRSNSGDDALDGRATRAGGTARRDQGVGGGGERSPAVLLFFLFALLQFVHRRCPESGRQAHTAVCWLGSFFFMSSHVGDGTPCGTTVPRNSDPLSYICPNLFCQYHSGSWAFSPLVLLAQTAACHEINRRRGDVYIIFQ